MKQRELNKILKLHNKWLKTYGCAGKRAVFTDISLSGCDFSNADLAQAIFINVNLRNSVFNNAIINGAVFVNCKLENSYLRNVEAYNIRADETNFSYCDLEDSNFESSVIAHCKFYNSALTNTNFTNSIIRDCKLATAYLDNTIGLPPIKCPETGSFIGWKKCSGDSIVKLEILEDSIRYSATGNKCRTNKVKVLAIYKSDGATNSYLNSIPSCFDGNFVYELGKVVEVKEFDLDRWNECSTGIHFFLTKEEAINYGK